MQHTRSLTSFSTIQTSRPSLRGEVCSRVQHPGSLTIVLDHCLHFVSSLTTVGRTDRSVLATLTSASAACRCVCRPHWQIIPATLEICILRLPTDWRPNLTTLYFQFSVRPLCIVRQLHIVAVRATLVAATLWQTPQQRSRLSVCFITI